MYISDLFQSQNVITLLFLYSYNLYKPVGFRMTPEVVRESQAQPPWQRPV